MSKRINIVPQNIIINFRYKWYMPYNLNIEEISFKTPKTGAEFIKTINEKTDDKNSPLHNL